MGRYDDPKVCKSFLLACCPHEILAATRMDMGECPKRHDLALRADYESAQKLKDHYYDVDACDHLTAFVADCDRKTEQAKKKLAETQEALSDEVTEKLGAEGNVEESIKLMEEVETMRKK